MRRRVQHTNAELRVMRMMRGRMACQNDKAESRKYKFLVRADESAVLRMCAYTFAHFFVPCAPTPAMNSSCARPRTHLRCNTGKRMHNSSILRSSGLLRNVQNKDSSRRSIHRSRRRPKRSRSHDVIFVPSIARDARLIQLYTSLTLSHTHISTYMFP